jgi:hypothetical protein
MLYRYRAPLLTLLLSLLALISFAQELFPLNEPASSVPKKVLGARLYEQNYKDLGANKSLYGMRLMYGLTSKLSVIMVGTVSNHHNTKLPLDIIYHFNRGKNYPFIYSGTYFFAKYRFISLDGKNTHFRVAGYGEYSNVSVTHEEAEPTLIDDTGGYGMGVITTWLKNRFAVSLTYGYIKPNSFTNSTPNYPGGPIITTQIWYGDAVKYNLSFGYRLAPHHYTNYNQPNVNIYLEFLGKTYGAARIVQNGQDQSINTNTATRLWANSYIEVHPGIQVIAKSNLRFDLSAGFNVVRFSYAHFAPIMTVGVQRYFYRVHKAKT